MHLTWIYVTHTIQNILVFAVLTHVCGLDLPNNKPVDLWLLGLFPFNGSWPGGLGQLPAVQMGLRDVNRDSNMLPGYALHMTVNDTQVGVIFNFFTVQVTSLGVF